MAMETGTEPAEGKTTWSPRFLRNVGIGFLVLAAFELLIGDRGFALLHANPVAAGILGLAGLALLIASFLRRKQARSRGR